mmetsp:Transcript_41555/g.97657  ORF Transcript_41555/g.97657 Transcript_41555/m.97657 type:complete len:322 (-) Transcript_41555:85-1050(-)
MAWTGAPAAPSSHARPPRRHRPARRRDTPLPSKGHQPRLRRASRLFLLLTPALDRRRRRDEPVGVALDAARRGAVALQLEQLGALLLLDHDAPTLALSLKRTLHELLVALTQPAQPLGVDTARVRLVVRLLLRAQLFDERRVLIALANVRANFVAEPSARARLSLASLLELGFCSLLRLLRRGIPRLLPLLPPPKLRVSRVSRARGGRFDALALGVLACAQFNLDRALALHALRAARLARAAPGGDGGALLLKQLLARRAAGRVRAQLAVGDCVQLERGEAEQTLRVERRAAELRAHAQKNSMLLLGPANRRASQAVELRV